MEPLERAELLLAKARDDETLLEGMRTGRV